MWHADKKRHVLKLTVAVPSAALAVLIMIGKKKLHLKLLHLSDTFISCGNALTFFDRCRTRSDNSARIFPFIKNFNQTHAARAGRMVQGQECAQRRNKDIMVLSNLKDRLSFFKIDFLTVKPSKIFHDFLLRPLGSEYE